MKKSGSIPECPSTRPSLFEDRFLFLEHIKIYSTRVILNCFLLAFPRRLGISILFFPTVNWTTAFILLPWMFVWSCLVPPNSILKLFIGIFWDVRFLSPVPWSLNWERDLDDFILNCWKNQGFLLFWGKLGSDWMSLLIGIFLMSVSMTLYWFRLFSLLRKKYWGFMMSWTDEERRIEFNLSCHLSYLPLPASGSSRESRGMRIHISLFNLQTRPWMNALRNSSLYSLPIHLLFHCRLFLKLRPWLMSYYIWLGQTVLPSLFPHIPRTRHAELIPFMLFFSMHSLGLPSFPDCRGSLLDAFKVDRLLGVGINLWCTFLPSQRNLLSHVIRSVHWAFFLCFEGSLSLSSLLFLRIRKDRIASYILLRLVFERDILPWLRLRFVTMHYRPRLSVMRYFSTLNPLMM